MLSAVRDWSFYQVDNQEEQVSAATRAEPEGSTGTGTGMSTEPHTQTTAEFSLR